ncbi:MAG: family 78 glycoside hydrolase catalytic domain [Candidatus Omnitrophica bacterium]|nr:family 78 glycoside hydrolase catalytic domain [Candidatus Omnitrophota bacterium]
MRFSSLLEPDGTIAPKAFAHREQKFDYYLKGASDEMAEPHFAYYGFQYVQVSGYPGPLTLADLEGCHVHTAVESVGTFSCSNELINRVQHNLRWTQLNNMHGYPTDCPQREKLGWTGDAHATAEEAVYNFFCPQFYTQYVNDLRDVQAPGGALSVIAPAYSAEGGEPGWTSAYVIIPWYLYEYYGDRRVLEEHYDGMKRWIHSLAGGEPKIIGGWIGDWLSPHLDEPAPPEGNEMHNTAYYYYSVSIMAKIAEVMGYTNDAAQYADLARRIGRLMNDQFFDPAANTYHGARPTEYRQTPNADALFIGIVPEDRREAVLSNLVQDIMVKREGHLNTGFPGTKALMEILPRMGRADVAYTLAAQTTYPSWIWPILEYGATTIPEWWDGNVPRFWTHRTIGIGTRNHPAFGCVGSYYYKTLAGIRVDPLEPGFKRVIIQPHVEGGLTWVKASCATVRGTIESHWEKQAQSMRLAVVLPANSTGQVWLPKIGSGSVRVREGNRLIWNGAKYVSGAEGINGAREDARHLIVEIGSGAYRFEVQDASSLNW